MEYIKEICASNEYKKMIERLTWFDSINYIY